jgi:hypothetical protein
MDRVFFNLESKLDSSLTLTFATLMENIQKSVERIFIVHDKDSLNVAAVGNCKVMFRWAFQNKHTNVVTRLSGSIFYTHTHTHARAHTHTHTHTVQHNTNYLHKLTFRDQ